MATGKAVFEQVLFLLNAVLLAFAVHFLALGFGRGVELAPVPPLLASVPIRQPSFALEAWGTTPQLTTAAWLWLPYAGGLTGACLSAFLYARSFADPGEFHLAASAAAAGGTAAALLTVPALAFGSSCWVEEAAAVSSKGVEVSRSCFVSSYTLAGILGLASLALWLLFGLAQTPKLADKLDVLFGGTAKPKET